MLQHRSPHATAARRVVNPGLMKHKNESAYGREQGVNLLCYLHPPAALILYCHWTQQGQTPLSYFAEPHEAAGKCGRILLMNTMSGRMAEHISDRHLVEAGREMLRQTVRG